MISLTTLLIRLLGQAASGALANEAVAAFLGFSTLNYLPVLLSLTVFIAVLLTLTRSYRDNEMVVWFCCRPEPDRMDAAGDGLCRAGGAAIAVLSLVLSPWALRKSDEYRLKWTAATTCPRWPPAYSRSPNTPIGCFLWKVSPEHKIRYSNIFMQSTNTRNRG